MHLHKNTLIALAAMLIIAVWSGACWADDENKTEKKKVRHPLVVLHADIERENQAGMQPNKGTCEVWIRNVSHQDVDNVKCRLVLRDGSREFFKLEDELGTINASKRGFAKFKWEEYQRRELTPQIFVIYNNEDGEQVEFETRPPNW